MKIYRVVPALAGAEEGATIEFVGDDPSEVFHLLEDTHSERSFTLWEGEKCLGVLRHSGNGFWELR